MGFAHKFGNNIDTDVIIPAYYLSTRDPAELAKHCMEPIDSGFASRVQKGDVIVAGSNFGCGSSREHAPIAIKALGISAIIAKTFARIFFRNAINIGLPILTCPEAVEATELGDEIEIDLAAGKIHNRTRESSFQATPFPDFMLDIIRAGGLVNYTKERLKRRKGVA